MNVSAMSGWYPDQDRLGQERYFDGQAWTDSRRDPRRRPRSPAVGILLLLLTTVCLVGTAVALATRDWSSWPSALATLRTAAFWLVLAAGLGLGGVLLVRPESAARARRRVELAAVAAKRASLAAEADFDAAVEYLLATGYGGRGVVAYRRLEQVASRLFGQQASARIVAALEAADYDRMRLASHRIGYLGAITGLWLEVYRDFVIYGEVAHDVDEGTRADVYLDGHMQVATRGTAARGRSIPTYQGQDLRRAEVQIVSRDWSMRIPIAPDAVGEARRIGAQLMRHVESLRPRALTAADVQQLVKTILDSRLQPTAEKLRQLSNLRYERLLSDEEFEQAKERILELER